MSCFVPIIPADKSQNCQMEADLGTRAKFGIMGQSKTCLSFIDPNTYKVQEKAIC